MGNSLCRLILGRSVEEGRVASFALALRSQVQRPTSLYLRDLIGRPVRDPRLVAAREAQARVIDVEPMVPANLLETTADATLGSGQFVVRVTDDEGTDVVTPAQPGLAGLFPAVDLSWLLEPEERPIPWNVVPYSLCPGNPSHWSLHVPIVARLLSPATPGQARPCPICRAEYTSKGERGQCPACGFAAWPFRTRTEADTISPVPLDAFRWGSSPFTHSTDCAVAGKRPQNSDVSRYSESREGLCPEQGDG